MKELQEIEPRIDSHCDFNDHLFETFSNNIHVSELTAIKFK